MTDITDFHRDRRPMPTAWPGRGSLFEVLAGVALANVALTTLLMQLSNSTFALPTLGREVLNAEGLVGTTIFSVVGALAMRAGLKNWSIQNWLGIFASSFLTANGGGTLRDLMNGLAPFWVKSPEFLIIPLLVSVTAFAVRSKRLPIVEPLLRINDNFATGVFIMVGVMKGAAVMGVDHPMFVFASVFMGVLTGIGGGIVRDLFLFRRIPTAFVTLGLINAFALSCACALWMKSPPVDLGTWMWLPAGLIMLAMNSVTSGRTFAYRQT